MSDRTGEPRRRPLLRAIVDSRLRTPLRSNLVQVRAARRRGLYDAIARFTESSRPNTRRRRSCPRSRAPRPRRSPRRNPRTRPPPNPQRPAGSRRRTKRRRTASRYCGQNDSLLCSQNHGHRRRPDGANSVALVRKIPSAAKFNSKTLRPRFRSPRIFSRCVRWHRQSCLCTQERRTDTDQRKKHKCSQASPNK